jgi:hypothetical protein
LSSRVVVAQAVQMLEMAVRVVAAQAVFVQEPALVLPLALTMR